MYSVFILNILQIICKINVEGIWMWCIVCIPTNSCLFNIFSLTLVNASIFIWFMYICLRNYFMNIVFKITTKKLWEKPQKCWEQHLFIAEIRFSTLFQFSKDQIYEHICVVLTTMLDMKCKRYFSALVGPFLYLNPARPCTKPYWHGPARYEILVARPFVVQFY